MDEFEFHYLQEKVDLNLFEEEKVEYKKVYDLELRTKQFAIEVRRFLKTIKWNVLIVDDLKQLLRSSGSVGANYIEANESFSKKDFLYRVKICRKEAKESVYWIELLEINFEDQKLLELKTEAEELKKIFGAIVTKVEASLPK